MIKNREKFIIATILLATAATNTATSSAASSTPKYPPKPPCRVDMPLAHISTNLAEVRKVYAVKANVVIVCDQIITHLVLHVSLFKRAFPVPILLVPFYYNQNIRIMPRTAFKISGPIFTCINWKPTAFFSEVSSTAMIGGREMSAPKRKSFSKIIACGD